MVKSLEVCFVKPSVINSSRDILKVDLNNNENLNTYTNINIRDYIVAENPYRLS